MVSIYSLLLLFTLADSLRSLQSSRVLLLGCGKKWGRDCHTNELWLA